jgi:anti-sigma factor RsiW
MGTEDQFTARLSDYLDGEDVSAADRAAIEAHLATCARAGRRSPSCAGGQPGSVAAGCRAANDLWAGVPAG